MRVALFDIDGTILLAHGAGRRAMERALADTTGTSGPAGLHYAGKTDGQIVREAMRASGFSDADVDARMVTILARYVANLDSELAAVERAHARILPGVTELLLACEAHEEVLLGLLTGNLLEGATRKLRAVGVDPARFRFGAYGSDHEHRPTLAAIAHERAAAAIGRHVDVAECVVIGDTPADVGCALAIGARAVGVATGNFSTDELRQSGAHVVFDDLSDTRAVMHAILHA